MLGALAPHRADQPGAALAFQRKHRQEIGFIEIHMQFAVGRRTRRIHVGDIENLRISAAWKARAHRLAHPRAGAVAARDIGGAALLLASIRRQPRDDPALFLGVGNEAGLALHRDTQSLQPGGQKALMLVLGENVQEGIGREVFAHRGEVEMNLLLALHPKIDAWNLVPVLKNRLGEVELPVKLERARMHRQGARGCAGLFGPVDDAAADAQLGQPQGQHQPGWASAHDQDIAIFHGFALRAHPRHRS